MLKHDFGQVKQDTRGGHAAFISSLLELAYQTCRTHNRRHATHGYTKIEDGDMVNTVWSCWSTYEEGTRLQIASSLISRFPRGRLAMRLEQVKALLREKDVPEWYWPDDGDPLAAEFVAEALAHIRWLNWQDAGIAPAITDLTIKEIITWLHTRQVRDVEGQRAQTSAGIVQQLTLFQEAMV